VWVHRQLIYPGIDDQDGKLLSGTQDEHNGGIDGEDVRV
jgi:hypothetical protein